MYKKIGVKWMGIEKEKALKSATYTVCKCESFGSVDFVLDETCIEIYLDLSSRSFFVYDVAVEGKVGDFDVELAVEFFRAIVFNSGLTAHIIMKRW